LIPIEGRIGFATNKHQHGCEMNRSFAVARKHAAKQGFHDFRRVELFDLVKRFHRREVGVVAFQRSNQGFCLFLFGTAPRERVP
jgi:hypothetical protein